MRTRNELVEEIMNEIRAKSEPINDSLWYVNPEDIRSALLKISDASMDSVEVEEKEVRPFLPSEIFDAEQKKMEQNLRIGFNQARTASQDQRKLFTK